jgi:hypothetical protein
MMNEKYVTKKELMEQLELATDLNRKLYKALQKISQKNQYFEEIFYKEEMQTTC